MTPITSILAIETSTIIMYALMIVFAIIMFFGRAKANKGVVWGRPVLALGGFGVLFMAIAALWNQQGGTSKKIDRYVANERMYFSAKMQVLADYLKEKHSDKTFLVVNNEYNESTLPNKEAVETAFGELSYITYEIPTVTAEGPEGEEMYEPDMMITAETFDEIMRDYQDQADVLVSLVGLPMDFQMMKMWDVKGWKKKYRQEPMGLVLVDGYIYELEKPIRAGMILAAVQFNPTAEYKVDEDVPENYKEAFDKRYILVHPDNAVEMATKYEGLFAKE